MDYYDEIKNKLIDEEVYSKVKDYSKERHKVITYFEIGKLLSEAGKHYGDGIIDNYASKLMLDVGKKYDRSTLFKIRKFYLVFCNKKVAPMVPQFTWSHCLLLIPLNDYNKINYYISQVSINNYTKRQLQSAIRNKDYERLSEETRNRLISDNNYNIVDFVKDPILIKNSNSYEIISEKVLEQLILEDIESFLKELGNPFSFIGSEYKIKIGDKFNYIDLLLFNYEFNCFVVVELKVTELKKEHIGQIEIYMNYIDKNLRKITQDKTIGIIICKKDNKYVIEYCSDERIIARTYELV